MTCKRLSDRMPAIALRRERWSEEDRNHLETCADCGSEWELVRQAFDIGQAVQLVDPERMGQRVLHRLATEPPAVRWIRPVMALGVAAAAVALLAVLLLPGDSVTPAILLPETTVLEIPMTELDSLTHDQLQTVLESIEDPLAGPSSVDLPTLMDLDDQQLERVIRSMEG